MTSINYKTNLNSGITVSVLIPIYNTERFLEEALTSLQMQTSHNLEFLCINDGSTDKSRDIILHFASKDPRFKLIDKQNSGYGASMNLGISTAKGKYIAILEPDDFIKGEMYNDLFQLAKLSNYPDIVKSAYWSFTDSDNNRHYFHCGYWKRIKHLKTPFVLTQEPLLTRYHPSIWSAIYRRDFLKNNKITFKEVPGAGWVDNPFMIETLLKAQSIVYTNQSYYHYRDAHPASSTANIADMNMPIDRWCEMTNILRKENMYCPSVWSIHAYKAFLYLDYAKKAKNYDIETWKKLEEKVFSLLTPEEIANSEYLSSTQKQTYSRISKNQLPKFNTVNYYLMLIKESYWKTRQNGIKYMLIRACAR